MQGKILAYDSRKQAGVIRGADNKSYYFTSGEWLSPLDAPKENSAVLFEPKSHHASMIKAVTMREKRIEPWLNREDYGFFKKLAPQDPELPDSHEEWLGRITGVVHAFVKSGISVERVPIKPKEFEEYCSATGINPDGVARASFAVSKKIAGR